MKFSIIVPTYNAGKYLPRCLSSIFDQEGDIEIIVMDSKSTDDTLKIARQAQNLTTFYPTTKVEIISEKDGGEPDAINKGLKYCSGDIIAYLDADDVYYPGAFKAVERSIGDYGWCYGKCKIIDSEGREVRKIVTRAKEYLQGHYSYQNLLSVDFIPQPSVFIKREVIERLGGPYPTERYVFDYEWWLRIGRHYKPKFIKEYLSAWRAHGGSASVLAPKRAASDAFRIQRGYGRTIYQWWVYKGTVALYSLMEKANGTKRANTTLERTSPTVQ